MQLRVQQSPVQKQGRSWEDCRFVNLYVKLGKMIIKKISGDVAGSDEWKCVLRKPFLVGHSVSEGFSSVAFNAHPLSEDL